jgi:uncharacterized protein HemY
MYRLILFFATLALFLFVSLYTPYSGQVVIILNQNKVTMDLWFSLVMLVLLNLILTWLFRKLYALYSL